jgi:hypothetical protein
MTDADDTLRALFAADRPPVRDPVFQAAVMEAVARRRFQFDVALLSGATALGALALWALWPVVAPALAAMGESLAPVAACVSLAVTVVILMDQRVTFTALLKHD